MGHDGVDIIQDRPEDIPDAEVWITKAALLGIVIVREHSEQSRHWWSYSTHNSKRANISLADWPGVAALLAVQVIQGEAHERE